MSALSDGDPTLALPFAHGGPILTGRVRSLPEDFQVDEVLGFGPSGEGEHAWLKIRKRDRNTHDLARLIARHAGVAQVAVGYAGLKDRRAVTTQHFTVHLPGRPDPDWSALSDADIQILEVDRHDRKIRRGALRGNLFRIRVRDTSGDRTRAASVLQAVDQSGVPNYFGPQRFGRNGSNLQRAARLFSGEGRRPGREQRGLLLSAARAHLFNQVLAERVRRGNWNRVLPGDVLLRAGSQRQFAFDPDDDTIASRSAAMAIHPSGPLPGRSSRALVPSDEAAMIEHSMLALWQDWLDGLARLGLDADRRSLRLAVDDLSTAWQDDDLVLHFGLPAGAYATTVLRELVRDL